jgi:hypothetical protein
LSLFNNDKIKIGKLICVKKTSTPNENVTETSIFKNTMGDFFADELGAFVHTPEVYAMSIC